jgi:hypothetical protein
MIRNYRVEIENGSVWDCFLSGFATVTCKPRTTWQTLLNLQQMMILTCMPEIKKQAVPVIFILITLYCAPIRFYRTFRLLPLLHLLRINENTR